MGRTTEAVKILTASTIPGNAVAAKDAGPKVALRFGKILCISLFAKLFAPLCQREG